MTESRAPFQKILHSSTLLYDAKQDLHLEVNVSNVGLGALLLQSQSDQRQDGNDTYFIPTDLQPVAYASRSLTVPNRIMPKIERELLAVLYGLEKFHH